MFILRAKESFHFVVHHDGTYLKLATLSDFEEGSDKNVEVCILSINHHKELSMISPLFQSFYFLFPCLQNFRSNNGVELHNNILLKLLVEELMIVGEIRPVFFRYEVALNILKCLIQKLRLEIELHFKSTHDGAITQCNGKGLLLVDCEANSNCSLPHKDDFIDGIQLREDP